MRVLVTGAGGFLGRYVVPAICRRGHSVRALGRNAISIQKFGWDSLPVESVRLDLCSGKGLDEALEGVDTVVHLAAEMKAEDAKHVASAEMASNQLVASMRQAGVRRLILASSLSVYDWLSIGETLDEQSPIEDQPDRRDGYTRAKLSQECIFRQAARKDGWALTILRPGVIWGQGIFDLPQLGQRLGPIYLLIGPSRMLPLTHVLNCAEAFSLAVEQCSGGEQICNVVDDPQCTAWTYLQSMIRRGALHALAIPVPYSFGMALCRGLGAAGIRFGPKIFQTACFAARFSGPTCSNQRIRQILNWSPVLRFEDVLRRMDDKSTITEPTGTFAHSQS